MPLTLAEARTVIEVTSATNRLLQLDEIWTAAAVAARPSAELAGPRGWIGQAEDLVDEMHRLLDEVGDDAPALAILADEHDEEAEETLSSLLWGDLLTPDDRSALRWWTGQHGGFGAMAATAASALTSADEEHAALNRQLDILRSGATATGDLTKKFRCGAAQQLMVGGVLLLPGVAGGGIALGLAAGVGAAAIVASTGGLGALAIVGSALWWARRHRC